MAGPAVKVTREQLESMSDDQIAALLQSPGLVAAQDDTIDPDAYVAKMMAESEVQSEDSLKAPDDSGWLENAADVIGGDAAPSPDAGVIHNARAAFKENPGESLKTAGANATEIAGGLAASAPFIASAPELVPTAYTAGSRGGRLVSEAIGLRPKEKLGDFAKGSLVEAGINNAIPLVGKGLQLVSRGAGNVVRGVGNKLVQGEATRQTAARAEGGIMQHLGTNVASGEMRALRRMSADTEDFVRKSGLFEGGTEYDLATGTIKKAAGVPSATTTSDISRNIDQILNGVDRTGGKVQPSLIARRDELVSKLDNAATNFSLKNPDRRIGGTSWDKIDAHLQGVKDLAARYAETPVEPLTSAQEQIATTLDDLAKGWTYLGQGGQPFVDASGKPMVANKTLTLTELNDQLSNVYAALRKLGKYDAKSMNAGVLNSQDKFGVQEAMNTLSQAAHGLKAERDKKIEEIIRKAGPDTEDLKGITANQVKDLNNAIHNLLSVQTAIDVHSDVIANQGSRGLMIGQTADEGLTNFSKQGAINRGITAAKSPFGFGRDTTGLLAEQKALRDIQDAIARSRGLIPTNARGPAIGTNLQRLGSVMSQTPNPAGTAPASLVAKDALLAEAKMAPEMKRDFASGWDRLVGMVADQANRSGMSPSEAPKIPRTIDGVIRNKNHLMRTVTQIAPEAAAELNSLIGSASTPQRNAALGTFLKHFPQVAGLFEDPESGLASEFDGKIQSQDDLAAAAQEIEDSNATDGAKALKLATLWGDRIYRRANMTPARTEGEDLPPQAGGAF